MKPALVLVHGAWAGAWIWRPVLPALREAGHEVHAVTLTGVGEREHLRTPAVTLRTHVDDVLGLVRHEELERIMLVGHSYGGMVITGVADAMLAAGTPRLHRLVYVDAMVPLPGESWSSQHPPQIQAERRAQAAASGGALPPADPRAFGIEGAARDWLLRRQVPHPFAPYDEALQFDAQRWATVPRTFIDCTTPPLPTIDAHRRRVREQPGWQVAELATGHCPMVTRPAELAALLLAAAR